MTVELTILPNGLRVVTDAMPHLETVSLGVWVDCGARSESCDQHGISHFLEHMAFKGTRRRGARQIAEEIEAVGGDLNAATSLETTAYYARILKHDTPLALEILGDILQHSLFDPAEIERERDVILQEIAAANDTPEDVVFDNAQATAFPNQSVGRSIMGTAESVARMTSDSLEQYLRAHYQANRMILSAAGGVDHTEVVRHAEALFGSINGGAPASPSGARYGGGPVYAMRPIEQAHVVLGFKGVPYSHDDFYACQVLAGLFGGGMSSRLFQQAREKRGLCYAIYAFSWSMIDCGLFGVHAATHPEMVRELRDLIVDELKDLAEHGPDEAELSRSKAQLKAGLAMSLESSAARAEQMARQLFAFGRTQSIEDLVARVDAVRCEDVQQVSERLASAARPTWALVAPREPGDDYEALRTRLMAG